MIKIMEHSFSLCVEKAREDKQGAGSAVLRWFNLQSISEVKSQLECMHLIFGAPRFMCTREFRDLYLKVKPGSRRRVQSSCPKRIRVLAWSRSLRRSTT